MRLGRSGSHIEFRAPSLVIKRSEAWQPQFMRAHQDVFVRVLSCEEKDGMAEYVMPWLLEPRLHRDGESILISGLDRLQALWLSPAEYVPDWRRKLLLHLFSQIEKHNLNVSLAFTDRVVSLLREQQKINAIHGDPTIANMLFDEEANEWVWIDPLQREYIPNDSHVDLGKMFQSCMGYERILMGQMKFMSPNMRLTRELAHRSGLDWNNGMMWCYIHIIRLLPYQEPMHRAIFEEFLRDVRL